MHRVGRIGMIGLGIALAGYLGGAPVFAGEQPPRAAAVDGSKITITSPKDGDKVTDSFELKYELIKGSQVTHVHVYVDDEYQKRIFWDAERPEQGNARDYRESCHEEP